MAIVALGCSVSDNGDDVDGDLLYGIAPACPAEVVAVASPEAGTRLQYPMTYVEVITGTEPASPFTARWTGIRRLDPPIVRQCLAAFVTDPPGIPCQVDTVVELTLTDGTLLEIVVGLEFEDLEPFADGRTVSVLLGEDLSVPSEGEAMNPTRPLEIRDGDSGPVILVIGREPDENHGLAGLRTLVGVFWTWDDVQATFGDIICVTEGDFCRRVHGSRELLVSSRGSTAILAPGESVGVASRGLNYRVTYRRGVERLEGAIPGGECGDYTPPTASAEMVRVP
jgi:hypothetical protein